MAQPNWTALQSKLMAPTQRIHVIKNTVNPSLGSNACSTLATTWTDAGNPSGGAAPTVAATCDRTTAGSLGQFNKAGSDQRAWIERADVAYINSLGGGYVMLVDRLVANGGLSGIVATPQSNGAWPALPRFVSGDRVFAALEIYTAIGATLTTATLQYTNSLGVAGRVSPAIGVGGPGLQNLRRVLPFTMQSGDVGVQSVQSVTLAASTGTAGNFGVSLYKYLGMMPLSNAGFPISHPGELLPYFGPLPSIPDNACLMFLYGGLSNTSCCVGVTLDFFEN